MLRVHQPPKPSAGCHPWTWASCRILLPRPPSSWSRERVCSQVSSVPGRAWRKPLWSEGWCGMERVRCCLEASLVLRDRRTLSSPAHQGLWGEGYPLTPPQPQALPQPPLRFPRWRGKGGGDTRSRVMGLGSGTTLPNQGQPRRGSKGDERGKFLPRCAWRATPGSCQLFGC